jgi:hypothetical protein
MYVYHASNETTVETIGKRIPGVVGALIVAPGIEYIPKAITAHRHKPATVSAGADK